MPPLATAAPARTDYSQFNVTVDHTARMDDAEARRDASRRCSANGPSANARPGATGRTHARRP